MTATYLPCTLRRARWHPARTFHVLRYSCCCCMSNDNPNALVPGVGGCLPSSSCRFDSSGVLHSCVCIDDCIKQTLFTESQRLGRYRPTSTHDDCEAPMGSPASTTSYMRTMLSYCTRFPSFPPKTVEGAKLHEVKTEWVLRSQRHQFYRRSRGEKHSIHTRLHTRVGVSTFPTLPSVRRVRGRHSKELRVTYCNRALV